MQSVKSLMDNIKVEQLSLEEEYKKALKKKEFKDIVDKLNVDKKVLMNYTSLLEESALEYKNCMNCKGIVECKNKISGYAYLPRVIDNNLDFVYKPCAYMKKVIKIKNYQKNVKYFNVPKYVEEACIDNIYKTDKKRFGVINWLMDFLDNYNNENQKGLYLHGNFGCGKTYLIAAIFNELARTGNKSAIIFWPEFLRQAFYNDFNEKFDYVKKVPLLLIDDIGAENLTAYNRDEILCPLLQYRMDNNLTTFFTSNLSISELEEHLANSKNSVDLVKSRRIISRINQLTEPLEMISKNLRK